MQPLLRRLCKNIISDIKALVEHADGLLSSEKAAAALFKGGIAMLSAALLALAGTGQFLYQQDLDAHKNRFEIEAITGLALTEKTDCSKLPTSTVAQCKLAVYQTTTLSSSLNIFVSIYKFLFLGGVILVTASALTYFGYALSRKPA